LSHTLVVMTRRARLLIVLVLNLALIAGLVAVGIAGHSVGLLAAGGDYFADSGAIALALLAIWLRDRPPTARRAIVKTSGSVSRD
jgi:cobalt-zinc-cadmium efflux system protein